MTDRPCPRPHPHLTLQLFAIALLLGGWLWPAPARAAATFVVDLGYDAHDSNLADGNCSDGVSGCTLRAALEQAFSTGGATITFDGATIGTVTLSGALGALNLAADNVNLSGAAAVASFGRNVIINASALGGSQSALLIGGNNNLVQHLLIQGAPGDGVRINDPSGSGFASNNILNDLTITGSGLAAVRISGDSGGGGHTNVVENSQLGPTRRVGVCTSATNGYGVLISAQAAQNTIVSNAITCNRIDGVSVSGGRRNFIVSNRIGLDNSGAAANAYAGVALYGSAISNTVSFNVIAGNGRQGVYLTGAGTTLNILKSNTIGLDPIPGRVVANGTSGVSPAGVLIEGGAHGNFIGTNASDGRNVIAGNRGSGVLIRDATSSTNQIDFEPHRRRRRWHRAPQPGRRHRHFQRQRH